MLFSRWFFKWQVLSFMLAVHPIQPYYGLRVLWAIGLMVLVQGAAREALSRARRRYDRGEDTPHGLRSHPPLLKTVPALDSPRTSLPRTRWLARMLVATRPITP